jgi:hypothetical protein
MKRYTYIHTYIHTFSQPVVSFDSAVKGMKRYDVCRAFLATLQLANDGNVEISLAGIIWIMYVCMRTYMHKYTWSLPSYTAACKWRQRRDIPHRYCLNLCVHICACLCVYIQVVRREKHFHTRPWSHHTCILHTYTLYTSIHRRYRPFICAIKASLNRLTTPDHGHVIRSAFNLVCEKKTAPTWCKGTYSRCMYLSVCVVM